MPPWNRNLAETYYCYQRVNQMASDIVEASPRTSVSDLSWRLIGPSRRRSLYL